MTKFSQRSSRDAVITIFILAQKGKMALKTPFVPRELRPNRFISVVIPNVLYFGPEKCLKEFISRVRLASKRQVWSTFFSPKFRVTCQKASFLFWIVWITCGRCFRKGKFGPDFTPNLDQTCLFEQFESGPNLPFRSKSNTWFWTLSNTFLDQNIRR